MIETVGSIDGRPVREATLRSDAGVMLKLMNWGGVVRDWQVPVAGTMRRVVLGLDDPADYPQHSPHFGAIAGRYANRIAKGRFTLDGQTHQLPCNNGENHLHGGPQGFGKRFWDLEADGREARLTLVSPAGDAGYPGTVQVAVTYRLDGHRVSIDFHAETDAPTPVNLVQHHYFNLMGGGDVLDHRLTLAADAVTEVDAGLIPTGRLLPVEDTAFDFRRPRPFRAADGTPQPFDTNFVLDAGRDRAGPAAVLQAPDGSLTLRLWTDRPGVQVYNGAKVAVAAPGLGGAQYGAYAGVCLEDQDFPDAPNHAHFPAAILRPGTPYRRACVIEIA
jgi:aldose 1-epimerase